MNLLSLEDGKFLVVLSRKAVEEYLSKGRKISPPEDTPSSLFERRGVFVTIRQYPSNALRGCIGYPEPVMPLVEATIEAAISAAVRDPRFYPMAYEELSGVTFEVTVLTPPELIGVSPEERPGAIKVGRDGLIVRCGWAAGLLLPQVPVEFGWNEQEFLSQVCIKAGLSPDCWLDEGCDFYRFQGQIFEEKRPYGEIVEKEES